jgi:broad specificity phosphatase PhoE
MTTTINLVRHGATPYNEAGRFMGTLDVPLSAAGMQQALALRSELADLAFDAMYASPLMRAHQTAQLALGMADPSDLSLDALPLQTAHAQGAPACSHWRVDAAWMERSFGELQGHSRQDYLQRFPQYADRHITKSYDDKPVGGESFADLEARVLPALQRMIREHAGQRVLIVTHHGPLRVVARHFENLSIDAMLRLRFEHCRLVTFTC